MPDPSLPLYRSMIQAEWIDYNGHMSEAFYVLLFGKATDFFYDLVGMDNDFRSGQRISIYTLEAHIRYLKEGYCGDRLSIETRVLACDARSLRLHHIMLREDDQEMLAITELLVMHIDKAAMRASPFHPGPRARIEAVKREQGSFPPPVPVLSRHWTPIVPHRLKS